MSGTRLFCAGKGVTRQIAAMNFDTAACPKRQAAFFVYSYLFVKKLVFFLCIFHNEKGGEYIWKNE